MKKVQGGSFSVRFTRRGVMKVPVMADNESGGVVYAQTQIFSESETAMTECFERAPAHAIHPEQEHTAPRAPERAGVSSTPVLGLKEKALWHAAKSGDCYAIRLLIMDGVDIDARDVQGRTAINIATQYSQQAALKTLLAGKEMRRMAKLGELPSSVFFDKFKKNKTA